MYNRLHETVMSTVCNSHTLSTFTSHQLACNIPHCLLNHGVENAAEMVGTPNSNRGIDDYTATLLFDLHYRPSPTSAPCPTYYQPVYPWVTRRGNYKRGFIPCSKCRCLDGIRLLVAPDRMKGHPCAKNVTFLKHYKALRKARSRLVYRLHGS